MTQITNVLVVATVFIGLQTPVSTFDNQRSGAYTRDICRNLSQKCSGGLFATGGGVRNYMILRY